MGRTSDAKARLMQAALDLLWEENYGGVTIDDICKRADVRKGSFYYFFPGKAELAVAAIEAIWTNEWKPALDACFSPTVEPLDRLRNYLSSVAEKQSTLAVQHGKVLGCPLATVGCEISTSEADVCGAVRGVFSRKRRYFESAIRDAVTGGVIEPCDAAQRALALQALIDGLVTQARIMNDVTLLVDLPALGFDLLRAQLPVPANV
jgi:TetR/AcrR family transcriptional repressor of nem operon